jgi:hypothetical protein
MLKRGGSEVQALRVAAGLPSFSAFSGLDVGTGMGAGSISGGVGMGQGPVGPGHGNDMGSGIAMGPTSMGGHASARTW